MPGIKRVGELKSAEFSGYFGQPTVSSIQSRLCVFNLVIPLTLDACSRPSCWEEQGKTRRRFGRGWFICWALNTTPVQPSSIISKRSRGFMRFLFSLVNGLLFLGTLMVFKSLRAFHFPSMSQILEAQCWWLKSRHGSHTRNSLLLILSAAASSCLT